MANKVIQPVGVWNYLKQVVREWLDYMQCTRNNDFYLPVMWLPNSISQDMNRRY